MKYCHKCRTLIEVEKVSLREECPHCGADLHACLNCKFYDTTKSNACQETQAERVQEKEKATYCDYFSFREGSTEKSGKESAQKLWDELFRKG
jgi:hypothetical protein